MNPRDLRPLPSPSAALLLFAVVLTSNVLLGYWLSGSERGQERLLVATPLLLLFWTLLAVWYFRVDPRETLFLRLPSRSDFLMAVPLAVSFVVLSDQLSSFSDDWVPEPLKQEWIRLIRAESAGEWLLKIGTIGIGAAVSEELLFRGFIQNALVRGTSRSAGVLLTAVLFTVMHILPLPSFAAAGIVLGFIALATRSILVPVLVHFLNNAAALALVNLAELETLGDPVWIPPEILVPAIAIFVLTMAYYGRRVWAEEPVAGSPPFGSRSDAEERIEGIPLGPSAPVSLARELAAVPKGKRRIGWLVVLGAVVGGASVLLALFGYSLYLAQPQAVHAAFIDALSQESRGRLAPEASHRAEELDAAFQQLSAANESGSLSWRDFFPVVRSYAEATANGAIEAEEVDSVLAAIHRAVASATAPRRL